jgi:hemerythrin-like domain-containing protein
MSDPVERLEATHQRLRQRLADLDAAVASDDRDAARDVLAYLERAMPRHEEDEERSLFPRLGPEIGPALAQIAEQHREHTGAIAALSAALGASAPADAFATAARRLRALYDEHLDLEDTTLLPAARRLDPDTRALIAAEMDARRASADGGGGGGGRGGGRGGGGGGGGGRGGGRGGGGGGGGGRGDAPAG